jgi:metallo-beta-lactamase class B
MVCFFFFRYRLLFLFSIITVTASAQAVREPPSENHPEWSRPYQPFRIAGDLYYVGSFDLACYLITGDKGHILINTGLAASAVEIKKSVEALGFQFSDIKLLLTTQAHYDHLGAMAAIHKMTGAKIWVNAPDAPAMADGGSTDYALGTGIPSFEPVKVDSLLHDGDTIRMGATALVMLSHPGHTKGSCSYLVKTRDAQQSYTVLIANLPTIVTDKKFAAVTTYPGIASDYAKTLAAMKALDFDLWVASHASQFELHRKRTSGDRYHPRAFDDRPGYDKSLANLEKEYKAHLEKK